MRRAALIITLGSIAIWTILAIIALLGGGFGDTQWKILVSSMLITAGSMVALACVVPLHAGRLGLLPWAGVGASAVGFFMMVLGIWAETSWDAALKIAVSLIVAAIAIGAVGLIDGARLQASHKWIVATSQILLGFADALIIAAIWGEISNSLFWRVTAIILVLTSASRLSVPILHRMAAISSSEAPNAFRVSRCPFCGEEVDGPLASQITCAACEHHFRVLI
jgi:hypothetical protein